MDYSTIAGTLGPMRATRLVLCLSLLVFAGCKMMSNIGELAGIQMIIAKKFDEPGAAVAPDGKSVVVLLKNSKKAELPEEERKAYARQVAETVRDHYSAYASTDAIHVGFAKGSGLKVEVVDEPYIFTPAELGPPAPEPEKE
jgi:hypothetical protein